MSEADEVLVKIRKLSMEINHQLQQLTGNVIGGSQAYEHQRRIQNNLQTYETLIKSLERLIPKQNIAKQDGWKRRVVQAKEECASLSQALHAHLQRVKQRDVQAQQREALLARRPGAQDINMDSYQTESDSLRQSSGMVDEYTESARNMLGALADQRGRLKGVKRKILDIGNTLGLSNSLLRVIERTEWVTSLIVYGGMLIVLLILYWAWNYR